MIRRRLKFIITLGTGSFGAAKNNQITLDGYRASADIDKAGGVQMSFLNARIYGVSQSDMNSITTLIWKPQDTIKNRVEVYTTEGTLVFAGDIITAWGEYQGAPDVYLQIQARAVWAAQLEAVHPLSVPGGVQVEDVLKKIADGLKLKFENNNVHVTLTDVYVASNLVDQARDLAIAANCDLYIDDKVLAITNRASARQGLIPRVAPDSGLVGYPTFDGTGVVFRTLFNPAIVFGGAVRLVTDLPQAAGQWIVTSLAHNLESEKPNGNWFTTVRGNASGLAITN